MISHLIAVFVGAAFIGAPVGIAVMAWLAARRVREMETEIDMLKAGLSWSLKTTRALAILNLQRNEPEESDDIDWSVLGV